MSRDYTQLRVFSAVDELVLDVYLITRAIPEDEKFGLTAQLRRAAVSVPTNIVEGSVRRSEKIYLNFLETALGSASEVRYLLGLSVRLGFLKRTDVSDVEHRYSDAIKSLQKLATTIEQSLPKRRRPIAGGR